MSQVGIGQGRGTDQQQRRRLAAVRQHFPWREGFQRMLMQGAPQDPDAHAGDHLEQRRHDQRRAGQALGPIQHEDRQQKYAHRQHCRAAQHQGVGDRHIAPRRQLAAEHHGEDAGDRRVEGRELHEVERAGLAEPQLRLGRGDEEGQGEGHAGQQDIEDDGLGPDSHPLHASYSAHSA